MGILSFQVISMDNFSPSGRIRSPQGVQTQKPQPRPVQEQAVPSEPQEKKSSWIRSHPWWTLIIVLGLVFLVAYLISKSSFCRDKDGKKKDNAVCNVASDIAS